MKLALHRSVTFWSGLLVMGFLLWAWRDSYYRVGSMTYDTWAANSANGGMLVSYHGTDRFPRFNASYGDSPGMHPEWAWFQPLVVLRGKAGPPPDWAVTMPRMRDARNAYELHSLVNEYQPRDRWRVYIPHWLPLLGFALPWTALLAWRAKRRRKRMTNAKLPSAECRAAE